MGKKFDAKSLNAVDEAYSMISEAIEKPMPISTVQNINQPAKIETKQEDFTKNKQLSEEKKEKASPRKKGQKTTVEIPDTSEETIGLNINVPISIYTRMSMMKLSKRKPLNQIGLEAIIKWLDKNGY